MIDNFQSSIEPARTALSEPFTKYLYRLDESVMNLDQNADMLSAITSAMHSLDPSRSSTCPTLSCVAPEIET